MFNIDPYCKTTISQKASISLWSAMLFLIVSSNVMYRLTNSIGLKTLNLSGSPNIWGYILHSIVFALLVFGSMFL